MADIQKKERIKGRKNFPTQEIDPINFIEDEEVQKMVKSKDTIKFNQDDFVKLYNCVHCGECSAEKERIMLKQKFLEDGNSFEGLDEIIECFKRNRTPYPTNKMRIKRSEGIPETSDTLFFMGCLSTIRIPKYTEHALQYLLQNNIDFTILNTEICCGYPWYVSGRTEEFETSKKENIEIFENYKRVICLCPACYYVYNTFYKPEMNKKVEFKYVSDYLKPSETKKSGKVSVQHLCQLMNRGREGVEKMVESVLIKSGYEVLNVPHWCCGGGIGFMHRIDTIDAIARKRMQDFKGDFCTTYCVSCWWILERYSKLCKIEPKAKDIFELLL